MDEEGCTGRGREILWRKRDADGVIRVRVSNGRGSCMVGNMKSFSSAVVVVFVVHARSEKEREPQMVGLLSIFTPPPITVLTFPSSFPALPLLSNLPSRQTVCCPPSLLGNPPNPLSPFCSPPNPVPIPPPTRTLPEQALDLLILTPYPRGPAFSSSLSFFDSARSSSTNEGSSSKGEEGGTKSGIRRPPSPGASTSPPLQELSSTPSRVFMRKRLPTTSGGIPMPSSAPESRVRVARWEVQNPVARWRSSSGLM
ncbi:hypothetical protein BDY24DRAFT_378458 [Mrakia frigida]|uniref:uncharacterized protein n=1 Tax=Mrakia frigida TaxID=29902 RepID=UPI003FCBF84E